MPNERILIVEDEKLIRWSLRTKLLKQDFKVVEAGDVAEARRLLDDIPIDLVILDQRLPDGYGMELLQKISREMDHIAVVMLTAVNQADVAVKALKLGALEYIQKPIDDENLDSVVRQSLDVTRLRRNVAAILREQEKEYSFIGMLGVSLPMKNVFEIILKIAMSPSTTVLITGESGTGKELAAKAIHRLSDRKEQPFVTVNSSSIAETLIESELYGHEKGAFTDAKAQKKGVFELASNGTVFLDEIGDVSHAMQVKLLCVIEEKTFKRIGGLEDISVDVRVIAATNRSLDELVKNNEFRTDLFYRLNVAGINMPPVRERSEDIIYLAEYFLDRFNKKFRKNFRGLTKETMELFSKYRWPGNVREIRNVIERAVLLYEDSYLLPGHVDLDRQMNTENENELEINLDDGGFSFEDLEKTVLVKALEKTKGNQSNAAGLLKMSRHTLRYRLKKYNLL